MNKFFTILALLSPYSLIIADQISITNKTEKPVHAAFYYTKRQTSQKIEKLESFEILPNQTKNVERPERQWYFGGVYDRDLYFDYTNNLPKTIEKGARHFVNLGDLRGSTFYIAINQNGELDGFNELTYSALPAMKAIEDTVYETNRNTFLKKPYVSTDAEVRNSNILSPQETKYINDRSKITQNAFKNLLINQVENGKAPRIAVCFSGGGYRAMIATLGFLKGAKKIGLLDAITYQAALSGSSWALTGWIKSEKDIDIFSENLSGKLSTDIKSNVDVLQISNSLLNNLSFKLPVSMVDIWGSLIAQKVLEENSGKFTIADLGEKTFANIHPYPLYTAVITSRSLQEIKPWVEFTPHEAGSRYNNTFIPIWAFGRKFEKGKSQKQGFSIYPPAQPLSFFMGLWGSAIAVNLQEFIENKFGSSMGKGILEALKGSAVTENRVAAPDVFNWAFGIAGVQLSDLPTFKLIDAGLDFNLPLPSLLCKERSVDIIIVIDASASIISKPAAQLKKAEEYAQKNNLSFPTIDYSITKNNCSVHFGDPQKSVPTIIYIPVRANPSYQNGWYADPKNDTSFTRTENFVYTREQVNQLSGLVEHTIVSSKETIIDAIKKGYR